MAKQSRLLPESKSTPEGPKQQSILAIIAVGRKKGPGRRKGRLLGEEKGNNIAKETV